MDSYWYVWLALAVFMIVVMWIIYTKAGRAGWAAIIPFYNLYVLLKVAGKPGWWLIFFFIPFVNIVFWIITYLGLGSMFGRGIAFSIGLILLPIIFLPILAFGGSKYTGAASS